MSIQTVACKIEGISPLLMHRFPLEPIEAIEKKNPEEQAELAAYRDPDNQELFIPALCVQRCLVSAATFSKGKGRASLQKSVAACVLVTPERLGLGVKKFVVDSQRVVMPATRGSVIRHRPRLDEWKVACEIEYDDVLLTNDQMRTVVDDAGRRVGILDFRPEKKGPYGRFRVIDWRDEV